MSWEIVYQCFPDSVRRFKVPGGWLYQVESHTESDTNQYGAPRGWTTGWHPPVFVPEVSQ